MKPLLTLLSKIIGVAFMVLAFLQWVTFDYPNINPFWPGAIFASGVVSQVLNWVIVCVLASVGWGFFTLWQFTLNTSSERGSGE